MALCSLVRFPAAYYHFVDTWFCSYAGALFAEACLKGLNGAKDIVECSYVASNVVPGLPFFSSKVFFVIFFVSLRGSFSSSSCLVKIWTFIMSTIGDGCYQVSYRS